MSSHNTGATPYDDILQRNYYYQVKKTEVRESKTKKRKAQTEATKQELHQRD